MNATALLLWVSAFSSFGWGVLRFFRRSAGLTVHTAVVAVLGLVSGAWHVAAIATSGVGPLPFGAGSLLLGISTATFWWAVSACDSRRLTAIFENDVPLHLVQHGPYRYIRHPFYASYSMFWLAGWIASGSTLALVSAAIMLGIYQDAIRQEERKFASSTLALQYADYRRRVGMLIPRLRASQPGDSRLSRRASTREG